MSRNRRDTIEHLQRLILHESTSEEEREAAKLALNRILSENKANRKKTTFADVFKAGMERTFKNAE